MWCTMIRLQVYHGDEVEALLFPTTGGEFGVVWPDTPLFASTFVKEQEILATLEQFLSNHTQTLPDHPKDAFSFLLLASLQSAKFDTFLPSLSRDTDRALNSKWQLPVASHITLDVFQSWSSCIDLQYGC